MRIEANYVINYVINCNTKRERDVNTAKLKAGGALTGGRLGPLQGGPRAKAKCGAGRAKRGGAGCS